MSMRREISEADAIRLLYLKEVQKGIRLRQEILDRDTQQLERDRRAAERAMLEAFERIGMADGEQLEEEDGRYFILSRATRSPANGSNVEKVKALRAAVAKMDAPKPEPEGAASGE